MYLPNENKTVLSEDNKQILNGFEWYDEDPQEYLDWEEEQKNKRNESIHNSK